MDDNAENAARNARHAEAGIAPECRCPDLPGATRPGVAW